MDHAKLYTANPHAEYSEFGSTSIFSVGFSTELVQYSQSSLLNTFSADPNKYIIIPIGSGSTGAIKHSIEILQNNQILSPNKKATAFVTPYEHHSNILPWVEKVGNIEILTNDVTSYTLLYPLIREQLLQHAHQTLIVSVSAASNVTSKHTDLN